MNAAMNRPMQRGGDHAQSLSMRLCCMGRARRGGPCASAGARGLFRPAHPPGGRFRARRRNGYPCPPGHPGAGEALGQSVVIENKPGAGGYIAWNYVAAADPDGYTLLMAENAIAISQALYKKTSSFDPVKQ